MGFVNHEQLGSNPFGHPLEGWSGKALGSDVEQSFEAAHDLTDYRPLLLHGLRAVQDQRRNAELLHLANLVGHKGDQGRNDDSQATAQDRRKLKAETFPGSSRHHAEGVAPGEDVVDDRALVRAKVVEPETSLEDLEEGIHDRSFTVSQAAVER